MSNQKSIETDADGQKTHVAAAPLDLVHTVGTDPGVVRDHNEDYAGFHIPRDSQRRAQKGSMYLLADGMGGHQAGEVASQGAVETVIREYYRDTGHDVATSLVRAFRVANEQIHRDAQSNAARSGMGTTLVVAVILGRKVYIASVGDSRAYLINARGIRQITEDHSWVAEQIRANLLSPEQARNHPQRNVVTRALGPRPTVEVDLFEGEVSEGDRLVLCSDGVTTHLEDAELAALVLSRPPEEAARQVVAQANERGGRDNISLLIVTAQKAAPPPPPRARAAARGRRAPLAPILAVAVLALLAAGGLWGGRLLLGRRAATATVAVALVATTPAQPSNTASPAPTSQATVAAASPTLPLTGTVETPLPTSTLIPTATAGSGASPQPSSSPGTPAGPAASATAPAASATPEESPEGAATLLSPPANETLSGEVTFEWRWDHRPLGPTLFFDLRIWSEAEERAGQEPRGVIEPQKGTVATIVLEGVQSIEEHKNDQGQAFYWAVVVVRKLCPDCRPKIVSQWGEKRRFIYGGPGDSGPAAGETPEAPAPVNPAPPKP